VHLVPMLTERGWTPDKAASALAVAGISGMIGRIVIGFIIDRIFAPYVGAAFFLLATVGIFLLVEDRVVLLGVIFVGLAAGAEIDMMGFLASRYFGLIALGKIYGLLFALFTVGAGLGPFLIGLSFTSTKAYSVGFNSAAILMLIAGLIIVTLGPYRYRLGGAASSRGRHLREGQQVMVVLDPYVLRSLPSHNPQDTGPYFARLLTDTK